MVVYIGLASPVKAPLIGPPEQARGTARHYYTFINGRFVRDRVVMSAVQSAVGRALGEVEAEVMARLDAVTVESLCWQAQGDTPPKGPHAAMDFSI